MRSGRGVRGLGSSTKRNTLVGIAVVVVLLVVVDVVLVTLAFAHTAPEAHGDPRPAPSFTGVPDGSARTPTPSATATPGATAQGAADVSARRLLSAVDGQEAWRASSGTCSGSTAVLEHTTDGGSTWSPVTLSGDVRALWGLRATAEGVTILAAVGDSCTASERTSTDDGASWKPALPGAVGAAVTPDGVRLGATTVAPPCTKAVDAFRGTVTSLVVCDDELAWRTGTASWVDVPISGVRGVAVDASEYTFARIGSPTCAGVSIETMTALGVTGATKATPVGCDAVSTSAPIAIDRVGPNVWLWAADAVTVSADGGETW